MSKKVIKNYIIITISMIISTLILLVLASFFYHQNIKITSILEFVAIVPTVIALICFTIVSLNYLVKGSQNEPK